MTTDSPLLTNRDAMSELQNEQSAEVQEFRRDLDQVADELTEIDATAQLEALREATDPDAALDALSARVSSIETLSLASKDISSAEIIQVLQDKFPDNPQLIQLLLTKFGKEFQYLDESGTEKTSEGAFLDWALQSGMNATLLGQIADGGMVQKSLDGLRDKQPETGSPADDFEKYNRAVLAGALEFYVQDPKINEIIIETRFAYMPIQRLERLRTDEQALRESLQFPRFELLAYTVKRLERNGYNESGADKVAIRDRLLEEFRDAHDASLEQPQVVKRSMLIFYEYPELVGIARNPSDGTVDTEAVEGYLVTQWTNLRAPKPDPITLEGRAGDMARIARDGLGTGLGAILDFFKSKNYSRPESKPGIEKLASALDLGDVLHEDVADSELLRNDIDQLVRSRARSYAESLKGVNLDNEIQRDRRSPDQLSEEELKEIQALYDTIDPEWEGTKAARIYRERVLESYCEPGMPLQKTFEEFTQEDYQMSWVRKMFIKFKLFNIVEDWFGDQFAWLSGLLFEKDETEEIEGLETPEETIEKLLIGAKRRELLAALLVSTQWTDINAPGLDPATREATLGGLEYEQLQKFESKILGTAEASVSPQMKELRRKNITLDNLFYLSDQEVSLVTNGFRIKYGEEETPIIDYDDQINSRIDHFRLLSEQDDTALAGAIGWETFQNEAGNIDKISALPEEVRGFQYLRDQGMIVQDEANPKVFKFHPEFEKLMDQPTLWSPVISKVQFEKLVQSLRSTEAPLVFTSVGSDAIVVENSEGSPLNVTGINTFGSVYQIVDALDAAVDWDTTDEIKHKAIELGVEPSNVSRIEQALKGFQDVTLNGSVIQMPVHGKFITLDVSDMRENSVLELLEKAKTNPQLREGWANFEENKSKFFDASVTFPFVYGLDGIVDEYGQPTEKMKAICGSNFSGTLRDPDGDSVEYDNSIWLSTLNRDQVAGLADFFKNVKRIYFSDDGWSDELHLEYVSGYSYHDTDYYNIQGMFRHENI